MVTPIFERPGRELCPKCGGDVGAPCMQCGGSGLLPFRQPTCPHTYGFDGARTQCGSPMDRLTFADGTAIWLLEADGRLPVFRCRAGHEVAIRFTPVSEERQAA